jgi:hypothetical protein
MWAAMGRVQTNEPLCVDRFSGVRSAWLVSLILLSNEEGAQTGAPSTSVIIRQRASLGIYVDRYGTL